MQTPGDTPRNVAATGARRLATTAVRGRERVRADWHRLRAWSTATSTRRLAAHAARWWLGSRVLLAIATYLALTLTATGPRASQAPTGHPVLNVSDLWGQWYRWDVGWYAQIAVRGYAKLSEAAYFPLFPALIRLGTTVFPGLGAVVVGFVIGNVALLFALVLLTLWIDRESGSERVALLAAPLLLALPLGFFLSMAYTDALFLALAIAAYAAARRSRWLLAAVVAFLAGLTRPTALILILPLAWEYARRARMARKAHKRGVTMRGPRLSEGGLVIGGVPAAISAYALYCQTRWQDPLAWVHAEAIYSQHTFVGPWTSITVALHQLGALPLGSYLGVRALLDLVPLVVVTLLAIAVPPRMLPTSMRLYLVGLVGLSWLSPTLGTQMPDAFVSAGRYMLAAFPVLLLVAQWLQTRRPALLPYVYAGSWTCQALVLAFLLQGGWLV
jgi:hypothetical protein